MDRQTDIAMTVCTFLQVCSSSKKIMYIVGWRSLYKNYNTCSNIRRHLLYQNLERNSMYYILVSVDGYPTSNCKLGLRALLSLYVWLDLLPVGKWSWRKLSLVAYIKMYRRVRWWNHTFTWVYTHSITIISGISFCYWTGWIMEVCGIDILCLFFDSSGMNFLFSRLYRVGT
jgi:hypothetical protein